MERLGYFCKLEHSLAMTVTGLHEGTSVGDKDRKSQLRLHITKLPEKLLKSSKKKFNASVILATFQGFKGHVSLLTTIMTAWIYDVLKWEM